MGGLAALTIASWEVPSSTDAKRLICTTRVPLKLDNYFGLHTILFVPETP